MSWLDPARPRDLRWLSVITTMGAIVLGAVVIGSDDSTWLGVLILVIGGGCIPGTRRVWMLTREQGQRADSDLDPS